MNAHAKQERHRWKMSAREVMMLNDPVLIPGSEWHPLDGGCAPEYIPEMWSGPHVGQRLIEGFKTLLNLPSKGISSSSGFWPETWPTWEDLLAREQSEAEMREEETRIQNRTRLRPSAQEISRMEMAISWPAHYLAIQPRQTVWIQNRRRMLSRTVMAVALLRVRDHDLEYIARKLRRSPRELRFANREGLDVIAAGMHREGLAVF